MNRPLLILDLDETLIHGSVKPLVVQHDFKCGSFFIHKRPFVNDFIVTCATHFDLAVWTNATSDYARCIVDVLFEDIPLKFIWSRKRCIRRFDFETRDHYWVKDLRKVKQQGFSLDRILMVDDTPRALERNYGNLIRVRKFFADPGDEELRHLTRYVCGLTDEADFRPIEKRGWNQR